MPSRMCIYCKAIFPLGAAYQAHLRAHKERPPTMTGAWRRARQVALARDRHQCQRCGATEGLQVHHLDGNWRNNEPTNLVVLCGAHHQAAHATR